MRTNSSKTGSLKTGVPNRYISVKTVATYLMITVAFLLIPMADVGAQHTCASWEEMSVSELHRQLAENKTRALIDREFIRRLSAGDTPENTQDNYDVRFYDISIDVDHLSKRIEGSVKFAAAATEAGVNGVQVDLSATMNIDSITGYGSLLAFQRQGDVVTVALPQSADQGDPITFTVYYGGSPVEGGFQGFSFAKHEDDPVISTLSEPYYARSWWPCKDRPDDKADSFKIAITVDSSLYVASNGTLDSTISDGTGKHTFYYFEQYPMASYLFSLAASNYRVWYDEWIYNDGADTLPLVHAVYPSNYQLSLERYSVTPNALSVLSNLFGPYPFPEEKYGHANFPWGGAMEHQTMSSMSGSGFGFYTPVIIHELAHQWWGNLITTESWSHIWLNEGWASYSEALYVLETEGWSAYHDYMAQMDYPGGGSIFVEDTTEVGRIFHGGLSYDKGAWVLHMLRGVVGDSLFFEGVEAYYNSPYRYGAATTENFRDVFEEATGFELDRFFEDWIYGQFRPDFRNSTLQQPVAEGGVDLYLILEQKQTTAPQVFELPVDFYFQFQGIGGDTLTLNVDERREVYKLRFPVGVENVFLDPARWLLRYAAEKEWTMRIVSTPEFLETMTVDEAYSDSLVALGGSGNYRFVLLEGQFPPGLSLSSSGAITGLPTQAGVYDIRVACHDQVSPYSDIVDLTLRVQPAIFVTGDINLDSQGPDLADLVYLRDYLYAGGPAPGYPNLADVSNNCRVDLLDLVFLSKYIFQSGPPLLRGCVQK